MKARLLRSFAGLVMMAMTAAPALAQLSTGNITGKVVDESGAVLPGVAVSIVGSDATRAFTTDTAGEFRFLNLPPGSYKVTAELAGFSTVVNEGIVVVVGRNVDLAIQLKVSAVEETVTVSGQSPIVDSRQMGTATNFTQAELDQVPTSRDPFALMRSVPGVLVDRVNIGGNETGQQSNFQSKGTRPQDAVWTLDGIAVTDMSAVGASPTYYNYDNFEEVQVSTSGQDIKQPTGGLGLNFVFKRGTNQFHGGVRGYFDNDALESTNVPDELANRVPPVTEDNANHIDQIYDWGFDGGGPIVRDRAWFYGSYSKQDIRLVRSAGNLIDRTLLYNYNVKGNWQVTQKNMFNMLWFLGDKKKSGRSPGDPGILFDANSATYNQANNYVDGTPIGLWKIEDSHTFGSSLFVTGKYAYYNTGFSLSPIGGNSINAGQSLVLARSFGSTRDNLFTRPNQNILVDSNYFANAFGASHDFKFGGSWRRADATTNTIWPGDMILAYNNSPTDNRARLYREGLGTDRAQFFNLYVGDTISKGRMTLDLGVRYDRQWGAALPSETRSNAAFPSLVPGIVFDGYEAPFTWNNFSPRVGVTYALDESRKTILRGSYSRYAGQLSNGVIGFSNPSGNVGYVEFPWTDLNGDFLASPNEVNTSVTPLSFGGGFNPAAPTSVRSANVIDPDLKANTTSSVVIGFDRELVANLAMQFNYSYSNTGDYFADPSGTLYQPWVGVSRNDYISQGLTTGSVPEAYSVETFIPNPAVVAANGNSRMLSNRPGFSTYYNGLEFQLVKRMSNRWMARVGTSWNNAKEGYDDDGRNNQGNPTPTDQAPLINGGAFTYRTGGSGAGDGYVHAKWQFNANGVYQLGYGMEVAGNVFGRQGYPFPAYRSITLGLDGSNRVLVSNELDSQRYDNLWNVDVRFAKSFTMGMMRAQLIADLFNIFNSNTEIVRNRNSTAANYAALAQNLSPRIWRFGAKLTF